MNTAVAAPLMEANILEDMARGPQQSTKSSFTVKDILQLPSSQQSYIGEVPGVGENIRQNFNGFLHLEERSRFGSTSSIHSDYGHEYGQLSSAFYPHNFVDPNKHFQTEQRSLYGYDEIQNRYQPEMQRENYLNAISENRYQNIGTSDHPPPNGKRVHSVESMAETSASPSPSTLSPSPISNAANRGGYFSCGYEGGLKKSCEKTNSVDYSNNIQGENFNLETQPKISESFDNVKDVSPSTYSHPATSNSENETPISFETAQVSDRHQTGKFKGRL